jgi:GTP cyclohydrolase I
MDTRRIEEAVRELLLAIGEDPGRKGLLDTPNRVASAFTELFSGVGVDETDGLIGDSSTADVDGKDPIILKNLDFRSICEHHLLPFQGIAHIAYQPNGVVLGLGRIARLLEIVSSRPQVQERIGESICSALESGAGVSGALVVLEAKHDCVMSRGVRQAMATAVTVTAVGDFGKEPTRSAVLALIGNSSD